MSDGPKILRPFEPPRKSKELIYNASRWMQFCKRELPASVGCIMVFFNKNEIGGGRGVTVGNVREEAVKDELRAVVKRWSDHPRIITLDDL